MERVCPKCGTLVSGDGAFCPECGNALGSAVDLNKPQSVEQPQPVPVNIPQNNINGQPMGQPGYIPQAQYYNNVPAPEYQEHMSVGSWVGTIILTSALGLISIILLFVWAFGGSTPQPKKNYCRAVLIFDLIAVILSVIAFVIIMCVVGWNFERLADMIEEYLGLGSGYGFEFRF